MVPDCVVWRQRGIWRAALAGNTLPRITIHRGYEQMIRQCGDREPDEYQAGTRYYNSPAGWKPFPHAKMIANMIIEVQQRLAKQAQA